LRLATGVFLFSFKGEWASKCNFTCPELAPSLSGYELAGFL